MNALAQRTCEKSTKETLPLTAAEANAELKQLPEWQLAANAKSISRHYKFKNFKQAIAFVNVVGEMAEKEFHHPDIKLGWGYADITYMTHSIDGLHINDFIMAARTDALV
ncbi:MAG: 4a-hydroxytetrahydrobiopterin dehydratase [Alphaproteobacteria bacterium]|nr:4a-hydroxytetrahydrobiopterin dehydratase [Alphaproteobacteria bacterium]